MRQLLPLLPLLGCPLMMLGMFIYMRRGGRRTTTAMDAAARTEPVLQPLNRAAAAPQTDRATADGSR